MIGEPSSIASVIAPGLHNVRGFGYRCVLIFCRTAVAKWNLPSCVLAVAAAGQSAGLKLLDCHGLSRSAGPVTWTVRMSPMPRA